MLLLFIILMDAHDVPLPTHYKIFSLKHFHYFFLSHFFFMYIHIHLSCYFISFVSFNKTKLILLCFAEKNYLTWTCLVSLFLHNVLDFSLEKNNNSIVFLFSLVFFFFILSISLTDKLYSLWSLKLAHVLFEKLFLIFFFHN